MLRSPLLWMLQDPSLLRLYPLEVMPLKQFAPELLATILFCIKSPGPPKIPPISVLNGEVSLATVVLEMLVVPPL